jgi:hypothetical protein
MTGRICNYEFASAGIEVSVGNINGYSLLMLGLKAIQQQGAINIVALCADPLTVCHQSCQLIVRNKIGVHKHTTNEGTLPVVDTAAGYKAQ